MSTISKVPSAQTNPVASASQSRLVKQVLNSNPDGVSKAFRTASANDIADAIRASNEVVAREVKGGKTGFRPSQVDALLRNKMFELDSKHPVLNEVIADGARSAEELQDVRDAAIATKRTEAEARRPYDDKLFEDLAKAGEELRAAQQKMSAAVSPSTTNNSANRVLFDLESGRAPSMQEIQDYNRALEKATTVEIRVNNEIPKQLSASQARGSYGRSYSSIAGYDTDLVTSLTVHVVD